jgi:hypothetical protein
MHSQDRLNNLQKSTLSLRRTFRVKKDLAALSYSLFLRHLVPRRKVDLAQFLDMRTQSSPFPANSFS